MLSDLDAVTARLKRRKNTRRADQGPWEDPGTETTLDLNNQLQP